MKPLPRKLRLLIIDDELRRSYRGYMVPESIEVVWVDENLPGIDSWRTALQFWTSFHYSEVPDLVLADVRFIADRTSPLSMLFKPHENYIPTGLSHLKTFAALSRALGKPLGVCARTIDTELWQEQILSSRPENKAMGYLAMHEIGELAAILGDGKEILDDAEDKKEQHIRNCYKWLQNNSATGFEEGLGKAVRDYRRSLFRLLTAPETPSIFVRPGHYAELMGWCERMRKNPHPLDSQNDIGLELTYHNGKRDLISLASVFADYEKITSKALDSSSFASDGRAVTRPWTLDDDARPRIGAYLQQLSSPKRAFEAAAKAVDIYEPSYPLPEKYRVKSLAAMKADYGYSDFTVGLIVVFQFVRIEQKRVEEWEYRFEYYSWGPKNLHFIPSSDKPKDSLKRTLQKLIDLIRKFRLRVDDNDFTRFALFDEFPEGWVRRIDVDRGEQDTEWVKWHFQRLVDAQILECKVEDGEDYYTLCREWCNGETLEVAPPAPRLFPRIVNEPNNGKRIQREPDRVQQLRMSLSYEKDDYNSVERVLADAFGGLGIKKGADSERVKAGRAILNNFEEPDLPFFLLEICRDYAEKYREWPPEKWPMWMRVGSDTADE